MLSGIKTHRWIEANNGIGRKVSIVTGASRGICKAIALKLASFGAKLAVNYVAIEVSNIVDADDLVETITHLGGEAMVVEADMRDSEAVKTMLEQVTDRWSKIDILVNNAGINIDTLLMEEHFLKSVVVGR